MKKYVIARNYLCVLALIEMIISDLYGSTLYSQLDLAEIFGITIPIGKDIPIRNIRYSSITTELGVHIDENKLNTFFRNNGIDLFVTYYSANPFEYNQIDEYSSEDLRRHKYILYTYSYGYLFNDPEKMNVGHAALFVKSLSQSVIQIYDPGPINCGVKTVNRADLHEAMLYRSGGIFVFQSLNERTTDCYERKNEATYC